MFRVPHAIHKEVKLLTFELPVTSYFRRGRKKTFSIHHTTFLCACGLDFMCVHTYNLCKAPTDGSFYGSACGHAHRVKNERSDRLHIKWCQIGINWYCQPAETNGTLQAIFKINNLLRVPMLRGVSMFFFVHARPNCIASMHACSVYEKMSFI